MTSSGARRVRPQQVDALGDGGRTFTRDLRLALARKHLDRADGDDADLLHPDRAAEAVRRAAAGSTPGTRPATVVRGRPDCCAATSAGPVAERSPGGGPVAQAAPGAQRCRPTLDHERVTRTEGAGVRTAVAALAWPAA